MPAMIDEILKHVNYSKVVYAGFSQGTTQMFYGISKKNEFFKDKVSLYVALAPCTKMTHSTYTYLKLATQFYDRVIKDLNKADMVSIYGPDWKQATDRVCKIENPLVCMALNSFCMGDG